ncbi:MAG: 2Fe-2S iron-sulfur cluster-binding protein [Haliea sp.]|uniref:2Fe-2S iron-sulfur cluster-binding protein n=1 Tax=Haliea sp. TaxID=1932666 RepID=UPI0032EAD78B
MNRSRERLSHARVDTRQPLTFQFEGETYRGYVGDTLASALLANGVSIVGRSFKLHRPRGVFAAGREDANALVQLESGPRTEPNARATLVPLYPGLVARGQNAWPSPAWDLLATLGLLQKLLPAGCYYKTFIWPNWKYWEGLVRRLAGLGRAPLAPDPEYYLKQTVHAEVVVVGAGRAGLEAALAAAQDPACRVLLLDEQEAPGGSLLASPDPVDRAWLASTLERVAQCPNLTLMPRTSVNAYHDHNLLAALQRVGNHLGPQADPAEPREIFWRICAGRVVLATGALERPLVFPYNDRPGIMLAGAVREYTHRYGLTLGQRIVFFTNNDSAWHTALELVACGVPVAAVVDVRLRVAPELLRQATAAGIRDRLGYSVVHTRGRRALRQLLIQRLASGGDGLQGPRETLDCDLLAISGGWTPTLHLYSQSGGKLDWRDEDSCFVPGAASQAVTAVGRANGDFPQPLHTQAQWLTPGVAADCQWVDFQYDVTAADIQLAARENYVSVEHVKRYTTNGMAIDQGKTSNVNGLGILALATGRSIPEVGTTRFRPPYHPVTIGAWAGVELGALYQPFQRLPAHACHAALGAQVADIGGWQRPEYYPQAGESEAQAIAREVLAVRNAVGLLDYSPLGKLEVHGPDAREFLNRMYLNHLGTLKPGAARYGLMLNEQGIVVDDGVVVCLAEDHFLLHTTSGGASAVHRALEEWLQCEWVGLRVLVSNVTTQWATFMLSGPGARGVLAQLPCDIDCSRDAFAHMQFRSGSLCGVPVRILRASFTGEVSFEVSVPAACGQSLWEALLAAGEEYGITPFGIEALMVLRTEKGYLHVGSDTDGNTMPQDLGWGDTIGKKPVDFVGRRSLALEVGKDPQRLQFTGIALLDETATTVSGAHVLSEDGNSSAGYVTSACFSPTLGRTVALGIVAGARARQGETVSVYYEGKTQPARLVAPCQVDPEGVRLQADVATQPPARPRSSAVPQPAKNPQILTPRSPLAGDSGIARPGFRLREETGIELLRLQVFHRGEGQVEALATALDTALPSPGIAHPQGARTWLWCAPGDWLLAVPAGTGATELAALSAAADELLAVATAVTDSRVLLRLGGARLRDVLARGTTLDLHPQQFGDRQCAVTRFAGVPVLLLAEGDEMLLLACRSLAAYLLAWFGAASRDC